MSIPANPLIGDYDLNQRSEPRHDGRNPPKSNQPMQPMDAKACVFSFSCNPTARRAESWKGSWLWDLRTDTTTWSEQLYWMVGRDRNTGVPCFKEHSHFYSSSSWDQLVNATLDLLQTGEPYELGLQMLHTDGTRRRVIARGEAVRDYRGQILQLRGTVEDINERNRQVAGAEQKPHSEAHADDYDVSRLIQNQERENRNVASALRENVCQRVSLLAASIQGLTSSVAGLSPETHMQLEELWRHTTEILCELDGISEVLHSSSLDLLGLALAIQGLGRRFEKNTGIIVECNCANVEPGKSANLIVPALFRIVEEALDNIARHSRAHSASVKLGQNSEEIVLWVSDDGVGFEAANAETESGVGFIRMKELVRQMRGSLAVWSRAGRGTSIVVRAPSNGSPNDEGALRHPLFVKH